MEALDHPDISAPYNAKVCPKYQENATTYYRIGCADPHVQGCTSTSGLTAQAGQSSANSMRQELSAVSCPKKCMQQQATKTHEHLHSSLLDVKTILGSGSSADTLARYDLLNLLLCFGVHLSLLSASQMKLQVVVGYQWMVGAIAPVLLKQPREAANQAQAAACIRRSSSVSGLVRRCSCRKCWNNSMYA